MMSILKNFDSMKAYKENYIVNVDGTIWNKKTNYYVKHRVISNGYVRVSLHRKEFYLHRVIAECFIPNPYNKRTVNHKDGNKQNNTIDNLEWMTHSENHKHAYDVLNKKRRGPVKCLDKNNTIN